MRDERGSVEVDYTSLEAASEAVSVRSNDAGAAVSIKTAIRVSSDLWNRKGVRYCHWKSNTARR